MTEYGREVELIDYIEVVLTRKWLILLGTLACAVGGILHLSLVPRKFEASALLHVADTKPQKGELVDSEVEVPALAVDLVRSVATADEIELAMNGYRDRLADSLSIERAGVSLEADAVGKTSLKLTVSSQARGLPVPILHAWTDTFLARTTRLTATESGRYYDFVLGQYDKFATELGKADSALESFEKEQRIVFLEQQREVFEEEVSDLQSQVIRTEIELQDLEGEQGRAHRVVQAVELDGMPIYLLDPETRSELDRESLAPQAGLLLQNLEELEDLSRMRLEFEERSSIAMLAFDRKHGYAGLKQEIDQLERARESYAESAGDAEGNRLMAQLEIVGLERELSKHDPVIGVAKAIADDDLLKRAIDDSPSEKDVREFNEMKVYSESLNPVYVALDERRAEAGARLEVARTHLERGKQEVALLVDRLAAVQQEFLALQKTRRGIEESATHDRRQIADQLRILERVHHVGKQHYLNSKRDLGHLGPRVLGLRDELRDRRDQLRSAKVLALQTLNQLTRLLAKRDRLVHAKETIGEKFDFFTRRVEEADIAREREKAASGLRVITLAQTPRSVASQSRVKRTLASAAVGFVVSIFLAFLFEYVYKARAAREGLATP